MTASVPICDLCGYTDFNPLLQAPKSMMSDSRLSNIPLEKIECRKCGLTRNALGQSSKDLKKFYESEYTLNHKPEQAEHTFLINNTPIKRSALIYQWMQHLIDANGGLPENPSILEVGCGSGELLSHFKDYQCAEGFELNYHSVEMAQKKGLRVHQGGYESIQKKYDLILSFGVIEHVHSPLDFLQILRAHLNPGGLLLIGQPIQDTPSYDVFFVDHIHHFFLYHLEWYFQKVGLQEVQRSVGFGPIINFSLHLLKSAQPLMLRNVSNRNSWNLAEFKEQFKALSIFLQRHQSKPMYAYGASECLALFETNTEIREYVTGVVDDFATECLRIEQIPPNDEICFILTLNPAYQEKVVQEIRNRFNKPLIYSVQRRGLL